MISETYNEDNMIGMSRYPDKFFDLAIVDPEYGIGEDGEKSHSRKGVAKATKYLVKDWDKERPSAEYFKELFRVSSNQIIWGYNYFSDLLPPTGSVIVWDKKCHKKYSTDMSDCEIAWCSIGNRAAIFRFLWSGMMQGSEANPTVFVGDLSKKEKRIHPTQKPVALYKWLLTNYAKEGNKIIDTHLGSQSSRIAAYDLGFDFYGWELDKDYYEAGEKRFRQFISAPKIFNHEQLRA